MVMRGGGGGGDAFQAGGQVEMSQSCSGDQLR